MAEVVAWSNLFLAQIAEKLNFSPYPAEPGRKPGF